MSPARARTRSSCSRVERTTHEATAPPTRRIATIVIYLVPQSTWAHVNKVAGYSEVAFDLKDVRANCFCASLLSTAARANLHATSCIKRARQELKWTMIGQMAIPIALLGISDLGRSVTPTFLFRNRFYLQLSPHCSKMNKKSMWEVKTISRFLSTGHGILPSCSCKALKTMVSKCELILWGTSPVG